MLKEGERTPGGNSLTHFKTDFPNFRSRPRPYSELQNAHAVQISGHYLDLINQTRAHVMATTRDFGIRPVLSVTVEMEDFATSIFSKYVGRECVCCPHRYVAAFSNPATANAAARAWGKEVYLGTDDAYLPSYMVDLPEDLCFVAWYCDGLDRPQLEYEEALADYRRSKINAAAVLCLVNHRFIRVHDLARELERKTPGNSCIPETFEYNYAALVVAAGRTLCESEREALYAHTGVSEESLPELASTCSEAVSYALNALNGGCDYGEDEADDETERAPV